MLRLKYNKPPSGEIRVPNKSHHINYTDSLFMSVYVAHISTLQSSQDKIDQNYYIFMNSDNRMPILKILYVFFYSTNNGTTLASTSELMYVFTL
jgi:hypothetical protein